MPYEKQVPIVTEGDVLVARTEGRDTARRLGFGSADQTRLATAISELGRNVLKYAEKGSCTISERSDGTTTRLVVIVEDNGPGIPDIPKAMSDGYTTGRSLGMGLPGTKRLVHEFDIISRPGYTRVTAGIIKSRQSGTGSRSSAGGRLSRFAGARTQSARQPAMARSTRR